jgi:hypothetical protein
MDEDVFPDWRPDTSRDSGVELFTDSGLTSNGSLSDFTFIDNLNYYEYRTVGKRRCEWPLTLLI